MKLYVTDFTSKRAFRIDNPSPSFLKRHDNECLVSIGLSIGEDVKQETVDRWVRRGFAKPVDYQEANHGGCQSACTLRGDSYCRW